MHRSWKESGYFTLFHKKKLTIKYHVDIAILLHFYTLNLSSADIIARINIEFPSTMEMKNLKRIHSKEETSASAQEVQKIDKFMADTWPAAPYIHRTSFEYVNSWLTYSWECNPY